ncbi:37169_t:CDS:2, partial [Gigaspora margarita]
GFIPSADTIRQNYLKPVFEKHITEIKSDFFGKPVTIIADETTNNWARNRRECPIWN